MWIREFLRTCKGVKVSLASSTTLSCILLCQVVTRPYFYIQLHGKLIISPHNRCSKRGGVWHIYTISEKQFISPLLCLYICPVDIGCLYIDTGANFPPTPELARLRWWELSCHLIQNSHGVGVILTQDIYLAILLKLCMVVVP